MKDEVYSWRVSSDKKADLEGEARREGTSLARLLDQITGEWLERRRSSRNGDEAEQAAIRRRAMAAVGALQTRDSTLASKSREIVRARIVNKHSKESNASRRPD